MWPMELRRYLSITDLSPIAFARMIGASEPGVRKWLRGERVPRPQIMAAIMRVTKGAVTANDFHNGHQRLRRRRR